MNNNSGGHAGDRAVDRAHRRNGSETERQADNRVYDLGGWLNACGWTNKARDQARAGFHAGWEWAASHDLGLPVPAAHSAYEHGVETVGGHFGNGFDQGRMAYESGDYPGGVDDRERTD